MKLQTAHMQQNYSRAGRNNHAPTPQAYQNTKHLGNMSAWLGRGASQRLDYIVNKIQTDRPAPKSRLHAETNNVTLPGNFRPGQLCEETHTEVRRYTFVKSELNAVMSVPLSGIQNTQSTTLNMLPNPFC